MLRLSCIINAISKNKHGVKFLNLLNCVSIDFIKSNRSILVLVFGLFMVLNARDAVAQAAPPERTYMMSPTSVNLVDTTLVLNTEDISIGSLKFDRSYISSNPLSREYFGKGWTHNFDMIAQDRLVAGQNVVTVVIGRTTHEYDGTSSQNYPKNYDNGTKVENSGGSIIFTDRDGTIYRFSPNGTNYPQTVSSITYVNGTVITVNNVSGRPKTIVSNMGYAIVLDYSGQYVTAACGYNLAITYVSTSTTCAGAALKTSYSYTNYSGNSLLSSFIDPSGNTTSYGYQSGNFGLNCLRSPGTSVCKIASTYQPDSRNRKIVVGSQTLADGSSWQFNCSCGTMALDDPDSFYPPEESTTMTEPGGATVSTNFNIGSASLPAPASATSFTTKLAGYFRSIMLIFPVSLRCLKAIRTVGNILLMAESRKIEK